MTVFDHVVVGVSFYGDGRSRLVMENTDGETELFIVKAINGRKLLPALLNHVVFSHGEELVCAGIVFGKRRDDGECIVVPGALEHIKFADAGWGWHDIAPAG